MKTFIKIVLALTIIFFYGCSDFLDTEPLASTTIEDYYTNEEEANEGVMAVYNALQSFNLQWGLVIIGDACSDDALVGGSLYNPSDDVQQLSLFTTKADNSICLSFWDACFVGISRANYVLKYIPLMSNTALDSTLSKQYLGETRFLRAYFYYLLVTAYGGVPILNEPLLYSEYKNQTRASEDSVWTFIENDLSIAKKYLAKRKKISSSEYGRISLGAVNSLLAKVYLFQGKYALCQSAASAVMNSNVYGLISDYSSIFDLDNENNKESIFEIQHEDGDIGEGSSLSWYLNGLSSGGLGFDCPTQDLVDEYESGTTISGTEWTDPRQDATIIFDGEQDVSESLSGYYNQKMYVSPTDRTSTTDSPKNLIIIRYADVLLMFAEAANQNGKSDSAIIVLNKVRARARAIAGSDTEILPDFPYGTYTSSTDDIKQAIRHERRVELGMEFSRFWDLKRQARLATVMHNYATNYGVDKGKYFDDDIHNLFPIPSTEITLTNGNLTQNPGY